MRKYIISNDDAYLAFVVSRAYKECKLRSILLKCARARAVHAARLGT